jgi:hypothetical protein
MAIIVIFFFSITPSQSKTTPHYCLLLLLKHKEDKTQTKKRITKKLIEGRELTFKLLLFPLTFGAHFHPSISNTFSWHLLLFKEKKLINYKKNHKEEKKCKKRREFSF